MYRAFHSVCSCAEEVFNAVCTSFLFCSLLPQFFYPVGPNSVDSFSLHVSVWTKSILGGKECLGHTEIKLHLLQLLGGISKWYTLSGDAKVVSLWSSTHPT